MECEVGRPHAPESARDDTAMQPREFERVRGIRGEGRQFPYLNDRDRDHARRD